MTSDARVPVAIVGGGFSGTILAAQLARRGIGSALIDGSGRMGKGVAYSTTEPAHLLNVRAEGMSAWAGEPDHFARRFGQDGGDPRGFAQRRFFANYADGILKDAIASGHVRAVAATATGAVREGDGWVVSLDDGDRIRSTALVLAVGNQEPDMLRAFVGVGDRFVRNPWGSDAQSAIRTLVESEGDALIIGTGLTMVDLALSLDASGYRGQVLAVSRRGLIPRSHADFDPAPVDASEVPFGNVRKLSRWLRRRAAETGWRAAIDSLRPHSHALWQSFDAAEQCRFIRHARPWWDVHRHRIAPEVGTTIARMIADGGLQVMAGRIVSAQLRDDGVEVEILRRGAAEPQPRRFARVFNCTGPLHSLAHTRDPLLRSLLDAGTVTPDQLGIGVAVDGASRASASDKVWAVGPLTKGRYWEIVAVPDIREQAAAVADDIARELKA